MTEQELKLLVLEKYNEKAKKGPVSLDSSDFDNQLSEAELGIILNELNKCHYIKANIKTLEDGRVIMLATETTQQGQEIIDKLRK